MTRRTRPLLAALALATALLATSCSSSGPDDEDTSSADAPGAQPPAATADPVPGSPTAPDSSSSAPAATAATTPPAPGTATTAPGTPTGTTPGTPGTPTGKPGTTPGTAPGTPPGPGTGTGTGTGTGGTGGTGTPNGTSNGTRWQPTPGLAWQWQLGGGVDQSVDVPVYDIDGFETDASVVAALHAKGRKVICYINAGSWEDFRPDAAAFTKALQGAGNGWKGEKWFDIRKLDQLKPLMAARFDMCKQKGFDAVEPDTIEAYNQNSGFPLTAEDQLRYNRMLASLAHERGLAIGLKNDLDQIPALLADFDFAVNEECAEFDECARLSPFIQAGKAVFHVEYKLGTDRFCAQSKSLGLSSMQKKLELDAWRKPC
ncbi:endo alpha-1,4 polygalactosaminidase [Streptomyces sp. BE303]|uniref:endo alpha-1,4 polygalactosaminidase n=2 Tax=Streptomycetaceae TaxID=2062 RepID=UPI002E77E9D2|nr:endo alpha-1,4 polygalactosaminidase [Streptomyces sp. BE303]MED7949378.1 endo alpha-1,4 polygalactosaminidase [Streptomyces sp. BE303]